MKKQINTNIWAVNKLNKEHLIFLNDRGSEHHSTYLCP